MGQRARGDMGANVIPFHARPSLRVAPRVTSNVDASSDDAAQLWANLQHVKTLIATMPLADGPSEVRDLSWRIRRTLGETRQALTALQL